MAEIKKVSIKVTLAGSKLQQYFPVNYTPKQIEEIILSLLESWQCTQ